MLGVVSYYLVPSLGPIYAAPAACSADLPHDRGLGAPGHAACEHRVEVLADPHGTDRGPEHRRFRVAAHRRPLHRRARRAPGSRGPRWLRIALWTFLGLTVLATVYFGWHYVVDDVAGVAIAFAGVYGAAALLGFKRPYAQREIPPEPVAGLEAPVSGAGSRGR